MDTIQRTVTLFSALLQRIKAIGDLITDNGLYETEDVKEVGKLFWIFNW